MNRIIIFVLTFVFQNSVKNVLGVLLLNSSIRCSEEILELNLNYQLEKEKMR